MVPKGFTSSKHVKIYVSSYLRKFFCCAGVCAMCGKQVLDTKFYKQSNV